MAQLAAKNTQHRYGSILIAFHWLSALLVFGLLASGITASNITEASAKIIPLTVHAIMGISILLLTVLRIIWWRFEALAPDPVKAAAVQAFAARLVHRLFYVVILIMALSGIRMFILWDLGAYLFAGDGASLPAMPIVGPRIVHGIAAKIMMALVVVHVLAALYHQFIKRDRILSRMGLG